MVGEGEELVHGLRVGVRPALLRGRAVDPPVGLDERPLLAMVAVDLRGRRDEHAFAEAVAVLEHDLRSAQVRHERLHRLLDDEPHADRRGQVVDDVALVDELVDDRPVQHRVDDQVEVLAVAEMLDVVQRAGREVVEHPDLVAFIEQ